MRNYLAILKDSLREALASRVLWIVLVLITLVLIVILPIGVYELPSPFLQSEDIKNEGSLAIKLRAAGQSETPTPAKYVWNQLTDEVKQQIIELPASALSPRIPSLTALLLRKNLGDLLKREDFYDPSVWQSTPHNAQFDLLYERRRSPEDPAARARLNRAALALAMPDEIEAAKPSLPVFYYLRSDWSTAALVGLLDGGSAESYGDANPMEGVRKEPVLQGLLKLLIEWFLGTVGVFVGILVTASIIPSMFEPGSIDLLFSKPVSRVLVFLTKFAGGCSFVLLSSGYFFLGLWLIFGLRMGFWADNLLLCIPLYLLLFSVYYSVSAVVGVIYRNAIVSVVMTILLWVVCFSLKVGNTITQAFLIQRNLRSCAEIEGSYFATDEIGRIHRWQDGQWQQLSATAKATGAHRNQEAFGNLMLGPQNDPANHRFVALQAQAISQSIYATGLVLAKSDQSWEPQIQSDLPPGVTDLLVDAQGPLLVSGAGIYRFNGDVPTHGAGSLKALGAVIGLPSNKTIRRYQLVSDAYDLSPPIAAAIHPVTGEIVISSRKKLLLFARDEQGLWKLKLEAGNPSSDPCLPVMAGKSLLLANVAGNIYVLSPEDLSVIKELATPGHAAVRQADISTDGRFVALVLRDRTLWLYDTLQQRTIGWWFRGQGSISAAHFGPKGLAVVDQINRLRVYELDTWRQLDEMKPTADWLEQASRYGITPLHAVLPQPGELNTVTSYLLADKETRMKLGANSSDPRGMSVPLDVWGPIRTCLIFMAVVLGIGCVYIHRKDF